LNYLYETVYLQHRDSVTPRVYRLYALDVSDTSATILPRLGLDDPRFKFLQEQQELLPFQGYGNTFSPMTVP
jgi:hypothetical protein